MVEIASWQGDWQARIYTRVRNRGFDTVTAFAAANPRATLFELAEALGHEDVNAAQIVTLLRDEAERTDSVERFACALLVHALWEFIPKGWRVDPGDGFEFDFKVAAAFATTTASLPEAERDLLNRVGRLMKIADLPTGWLPDGPDDPALVNLFKRAATA